MLSVESRVSAIIARIILFSALWSVVAGATASSWVIGLPAVIVATLGSLRLTPPRAVSLSVIGALRFAVFFVSESVHGGLDMASRIIRPRLRIEPGFTVFRSRLPTGQSRVLFTNCVSLLPGTLAADLSDDKLTVHQLDTQVDVHHELSKLELAIAELFGLELTPHIRSGDHHD